MSCDEPNRGLTCFHSVHGIQSLLAEGEFSSIGAMPQFNVLEDLDQPWYLPATLPALNKYWRDVCRSMDDWVSSTEAELLPKKPDA